MQCGLSTPLPAADVQITIMPANTYINGNGMSGPIFPFGTGTVIIYPRAALTSNFTTRTFYVTTIAATGAGSLYLAIEYANQSDALDNIYFNIPGQAPHLINFTSGSNTRILYPVQMDGTTQPANGYAGTLPKIAIYGGYLYSHANNSKYVGLTFDVDFLVNYSNAISAANTVVVGENGKSNFFRNGSIWFNGASNITFQYNYYGIDNAGNIFSTSSKFAGYSSSNFIIKNNTFATSYLELIGNTNTSITSNNINNRIDLFISSGTIIGGTVAEGNVINGGINIYSDDVIVKNNKIGVQADGTTTFSYGAIDVGSINGTIHKNILIESNLVLTHIRLFNAKKVTVISNKIGVAADGTTILNSVEFGGIKLNPNCDSITIGGILPGEGNIIAGKLAAVYVYPGVIRTTIRGNSFFANTVKGINLENSGMALYKPKFIYVGANGISGTALANSTIDIYYNNIENCIPQGKTYINTVVANASGLWSYTHGSNFTATNGIVVTSTATDGSTSEFSEYIPVNAGNDTTICEGNSHNLGSTLIAGYTYLWTPSVNLNNSVSATPVASPTDTTLYILTMTNSNSCTLNDTVLVSVNNLPEISVTNPPLACNGQSVDITTSFTDLSNGQGTVSYWEDLNATIPLADPSAINTDGTYYIKKDNQGCTDTEPVVLSFSACTGTLKNATGTILTAYPNPSQNKLVLKSEKPGYHYEIINSNGIILMEGYAENSTKEIDMSSVKPGVYYLKTSSQENTYIRQIIKF